MKNKNNSDCKKKSSKEIIEILNSIEKLSVEDGELDTWFKDSTTGPEAITGFIPGSFTRELLELIEKHMMGDVNLTEEMPELEITPQMLEEDRIKSS